METGRQAAKLLREMGLSQYEADAYVSLYRASHINASTVSSSSGVPRGRVYDVLQSLESMGLIISSPSQGKVNIFHITPHVEALRNLRDRRTHELDEEKVKLRGVYSELVDTLSSIPREKGGEQELEALTVIHGTATRDYYMKKVLDKVEARVTTNFTAQQLERHRNEIMKAKARGVDFTFMISSDESIKVAEILRGAKVYEFPAVGADNQVGYLFKPVRPSLMILDDEVCILFLYNSEDGLLIKSSEYVSQVKFVMGFLENLARENDVNKG